jgi:hypothetical protein
MTPPPKSSAVSVLNTKTDNGWELHAKSEGVWEEYDGEVDELPMYEPPGWVDQARDGWWSWILEGFSASRSEAARMVEGHCKALCMNFTRHWDFL